MTIPTCRSILAVGLHIRSAGFCQDNIIPEVPHLQGKRHHIGSHPQRTPQRPHHYSIRATSVKPCALSASHNLMTDAAHMLRVHGCSLALRNTCAARGRAPHLHLDEVEDLLLALGVRDLVQLLGEAAQHGPPTGLVNRGGGAGVRALVHDCVVAGNAQPVVQPAIVRAV